MFVELRQQRKDGISKMWFLSEWDKEDVLQHLDLSIWVVTQELKRNPMFQVEDACLFVNREVNRFAARMRRHNSAVYSNSVFEIENTQDCSIQMSDTLELEEALRAVQGKCRGDTVKLEVVDMYLQGFTVREIAQQTTISPATVQRHITNYCRMEDS